MPFCRLGHIGLLVEPPEVFANEIGHEKTLHQRGCGCKPPFKYEINKIKISPPDVASTNNLLYMWYRNVYLITKPTLKNNNNFPIVGTILH